MCHSQDVKGFSIRETLGQQPSCPRATCKLCRANFPASHGSVRGRRSMQLARHWGLLQGPGAFLHRSMSSGQMLPEAVACVNPGVRNGLLPHPDGRWIFASGSSIVVGPLGKAGSPSFLLGHSDTVRSTAPHERTHDSCLPTWPCPPCCTGDMPGPERLREVPGVRPEDRGRQRGGHHPLGPAQWQGSAAYGAAQGTAGHGCAGCLASTHPLLAHAAAEISCSRHILGATCQQQLSHFWECRAASRTSISRLPLTAWPA